ncbi:MAG: hypothetical protein ACTSXG_02220, partial [Alphaproteobacteria bacterium]
EIKNTIDILKQLEIRALEFRKNLVKRKEALFEEDFLNYIKKQEIYNSLPDFKKYTLKSNMIKNAKIAFEQINNTPLDITITIEFAELLIAEKGHCKSGGEYDSWQFKRSAAQKQYEKIVEKMSKLIEAYNEFTNTLENNKS